MPEFTKLVVRLTAPERERAASAILIG